MKQALAVLTVFVVSWPVGTHYQPVPCKGQEPQGVICAVQVVDTKSAQFKTEPEAKAAKDILDANKVPGVTVTKK